MRVGHANDSLYRQHFEAHRCTRALQRQACMHALEQKSAERAWGQNTWTDVASSAHSSAIVAPCRPHSPVMPDWMHAAVLREAFAPFLTCAVRRPQKRRAVAPSAPHVCTPLTQPPRLLRKQGASERNTAAGGAAMLQPCPTLCTAGGAPCCPRPS